MIGTEIAHGISSCMGGVKTAGDLVLRMQLNHGMKIDAAKAYVADKLGVTIEELCDSTTMAELRADLGLGLQMPNDGDATGMAAKMRIADKLGIKINSVERFKERAGIK